jgi:hypothetical protein
MRATERVTRISAPSRLLERASGKFVAGDPARKSEVVLDS